MPNYVKNILSFDGDPAQVDRLFSTIQGENGPVDFDKLIPMPSELEIESGSRTAAGFKKYMAFLAVTGLHTEMEPAYLATYPEIDREEWELGKQAFHNIREFGCPTWYEWRIQNWGTKWNASGAEVLDGRLSFLTAWNAPKPILEKLSQMFPSITIHHVWADEDIGHNCGDRTYKNGTVTQEHLPTGQEAVELGCDLWDLDPEEFFNENQESGMEIHCIGGENAPINPLVIENRLHDLDKDLDRLLTMEGSEIVDLRIKQISDEMLQLRQMKKCAELYTQQDMGRENKVKEIMELISAKDLDLTEYSDTLVYRVIERVTVLSR